MIIAVRLTAYSAEQFPCKRIPLIRCLLVRCMPCRNSLGQLPCLFIYDCWKAVLHQIFRQFSVISDLLMRDGVCDKRFLKQAVTAVFFISDNVLNGGLCPGSTGHSSWHPFGNKPVGDFAVAIAVNEVLVYSPPSSASFSTMVTIPLFCRKPYIPLSVMLPVMPCSYLLRLPHLTFSDIASDSDSANAAISVSISSPEDSVEWMFSFSSLWQYNEPKLRQTNHYKDWDRQNVKGGESFSRFLLYRKICPKRQPTLRVGAKLAAQYVLRPCCSLEFCLLAALDSQNSIKKHNRYE